MINIVENFISDWLKDILVVFILISFLEIILPKGKMKRFVNFIIGLLIILVIISPFTDLESLELSMDRYTNGFLSESDNQRIISEQENRIKEVFINRLSDEVKTFVENNSNYKVVDININTREEEETVLVQGISLDLKEIVDDKSAETFAIKPIQIGGEEQDSEEIGDRKLEILISEYLELPKDLVNINRVN